MSPSDITAVLCKSYIYLYTDLFHVDPAVSTSTTVSLYTESENNFNLTLFVSS